MMLRTRDWSVIIEVAESVHHGLEMPAVVDDGQITLDIGAQLGVKEAGAGLTVAEELGLDGEPDGAGWRHRVPSPCR